MINTEKLIEGLSKEKVDCKPKVTPARIFWKWLLVSLIYVAVILCIFGFRDDLGDKMREGLFLAEIFTLSAITISMAFAAAIYSFPDLYQSKYALYIPPIALFSFILTIILVYLEKSDIPLPAHSFVCFFCITMFSIVPAAWLFVLLHRQATVHPKMAGFTALMAACSIGALTLRLSEKTDSIDHIIFWHYLPMVGYSLIGMWLGKKNLKW